jgi:hypothetical protein
LPAGEGTANKLLRFAENPVMLLVDRYFDPSGGQAMGDKSPKSKQKDKKQKDTVKEQSKKSRDAQTAAKAKK